jgi:hypothetical protein
MTSDKVRAELARRWEGLKLDVAHADLEVDRAFHRSMSVWLRGSDEPGDADEEVSWTIDQSEDQEHPLALPESKQKHVSILIRGDCRGDLALPGGGLIHIYGDLANRISIDGNGEIVIGGTLLPEACIEADGIQHLFIGGDLHGTIRSKGSFTVCVGHDFSGTICTGHPITKLRVKGDFVGGVRPESKASLLYLIVERFMPYAALQSISDHGYTEFNASVAMSDRPPGIYPEPSVRRRLARNRHFCAWVIRSAPRAERYREAQRLVRTNG